MINRAILKSSLPVMLPSDRFGLTDFIQLYYLGSQVQLQSFRKDRRTEDDSQFHVSEYALNRGNVDIEILGRVEICSPRDSLSREPPSV